MIPPTGFNTYPIGTAATMMEYWIGLGPKAGQYNLVILKLEGHDSLVYVKVPCSLEGVEEGENSSTNLEDWSYVQCL